jgi:rare lipoprotein A
MKRQRIFTLVHRSIALAIIGLTFAAASNPAGELIAARGNPKPIAAEVGIASYYGAKFHGRLTANGETFDMNELTAAHQRLAFGTRVRVTHLDANRSVIVRINDRGPFVKGRIIDLSQAAAAELQMTQSGLARVKLEVLN